MRKLLVALFLGFSLVASAPVFAHHSFVASYIEQEKMIEGDVTKLLVRNPHSFLFVSVIDDSGQAQEWAVEWQAGTALLKQDITPDTVKPGDRVVIVGAMSRTPGEARLLMRSLERPSDGWTWVGDIH